MTEDIPRPRGTSPGTLDTLPFEDHQSGRISPDSSLLFTSMAAMAERSAWICSISLL
jgi:hypothetical protein